MPLNTGSGIEMRTPQMTDPLTESLDYCEDIFGLPRSYPTGCCPSRSRPSMISFKYKQKEERRKVLKISLNKLKKIDDPEASLCRSVLINNNMKRLQQETRNEKMQKQLNYTRCYSDDSNLNIKTEFLINEKPVDKIISFLSENKKIEELIIDNDFHAKLEEEINHINDNNTSTITCSIKNDDVVLSVTNHKQQNNRLASKKRMFDEMEECDMHDVLSQFYLPPTPRMLTGIDEDKDVNAIDEDPLTKRLKIENQLSSNNNKNTNLIHQTTYSPYSNGVTSFLNNNLSLSRHSNSCVIESDSNSLSCGHASMLGELQCNVYQNLMTSLET